VSACTFDQNNILVGKELIFRFIEINLMSFSAWSLQVQDQVIGKTMVQGYVQFVSLI